MPTVGLKLKPTVTSELTPTLNEAGISSCNLIRFKDQLPQKLGGWSKFYPFTLSGIPRDLHAWRDLNAAGHLSVGTTTQLCVITDGMLSDITPQTLTTNPAPNFTTTIGSAAVTVVDAGVTNVTTYDSVFFNTPISVGGIILHGVYQIAVIAGLHSYQIIAGSLATAAVTNGGAVPSFTTASGSSIVTVTLNAHGLSIGNIFTFPVATIGGGVTIRGTYQVLSVPTANTFTIAASVLASSAVTFSMNSGNTQLLYYINLGPLAGGTGYGVGGYGVGGFGSGTVPVSQTGTPITATDWTSANWGKALLTNPTGGGVYQWSPDAGFVNAGLVATAPTFNTGIFVAMPEQILVCYGSTAASPGSNFSSASAEQQDPLMVRWSDIEDYTNFTVSTQTQAGSQRISEGSKIIGGIQGPQQALIFTDIAVWAMSYLGYPLVFGFNKISDGCGLISQHAVASMRGVIYWMSNGNFFALNSSGVQVIPCSVWDVVFQNLDTTNLSKIRACPNSNFDEVSWEFPSSSGSGENDTYVKLNIETGAWDYGSLRRSAWIDQSIFGPPIAATPSGVIYQHETSPDADGQAMSSFFETGWFVIGDASGSAFVDWFFPDMKWKTYSGTASAIMQVTIYATGYPNETPVAYGPFTISDAVSFVNCRLRGRQIKLRFESNDVGSFWRLGLMRYRVAPDGGR